MAALSEKKKSVVKKTLVLAALLVLFAVTAQNTNATLLYNYTLSDGNDSGTNKFNFTTLANVSFSGGYASFNGSSSAPSYLRTAASTSIKNVLTASNNFTIMAAFKTNEPTRAAAQVLMSNVNNTTSNWLSISLASGTLSAGISNGAVYTVSSSTATGALNSTGWQCLGVTMNTSSNMTMYLNGLKRTGTNTPNAANTERLSIGTRTSADAGYWNGSISNVLIYDNILTLQEMEDYCDSINWENSTATIDAATQLNTLGSNFYGTKMYVFGGNQSWIDINGDGSRDTLSNYTWHQQYMNSSGAKMFSRDMYLDGSGSLTVFNTSSLSDKNIINAQSQMDYINSIGGKFYVKAAYTPPWLADNSSKCSYGSDTRWCNPTNNTLFGQLAANWIANVTGNDSAKLARIVVGVGNEPYLSSSQYEPNASIAVKVADYVNLYRNVSAEIHTVYPTMSVCAETLYWGDNNSGNYSDYLLGNLSYSEVDCWSVHDYGEQNLYSDLESYWSRINSSGKLKPLYIEEYNNYNADLMTNNTNLAYYYIGKAMMSMSKKSNVTSMNVYQWGEVSNWTSGNDFAMVSEPLLRNTVLYGYNVTRDFSTYSPQNSTVYSCSSSLTDVGCLYKTNSSGKYLTLSSDNTKHYVNVAGLASYYRATNLQTSTTYNNTTLIPVLSNSIVFLQLDSDTTAPSVVVSSPSNGSNYASTNITVTFNVTDSQGGLDSVWYNNGTANITVASGLAGATGFNYTNTTIQSSGNWTFTFYANDTYAQTTSTTVTFSVGQIAFNTTGPTGNSANISAGQSQVFLYTLDNPAGLITNTNWYNDGNNITACYNSTSCTVSSTEGDGTADYNITVNITSNSNNLTRSWTLYVTSVADTTRSDICRNGSEANAELARWMPTIALVIAAAAVIGIISLYNNGTLPSIGVSDLGGVATVLVVAAITISVAATIIISVIC